MHRFLYSLSQRLYSVRCHLEHDNALFDNVFIGSFHEKLTSDPEHLPMQNESVWENLQPILYPN